MREWLTSPVDSEVCRRPQITLRCDCASTGRSDALIDRPGPREKNADDGGRLWRHHERCRLSLNLSRPDNARIRLGSAFRCHLPCIGDFGFREILIFRALRSCLHDGQTEGESECQYASCKCRPHGATAAHMRFVNG